MVSVWRRALIVTQNIMDNTNEESSIDQDYLQAMENLRQDLLE